VSAASPTSRGRACRGPTATAQEEVYVVVAGSGRASLDGEVIELGPWDALRVAPSVVRSFEAGPDGLDLLCIGGRKPEGPDGERHPDPWG
jgi:mannose-6-phosphate isomerase-like protein (cupin superfamily)